MQQWLQKMRRKPKAVKDQYAFLGSFLITGVIAAFWLMSFQTPKAPVISEAKPFEETKSAFGQFFSGAKEQFARVLSSSDTASTTTPVATTTQKAEPQPVIIPTLTSSTMPRIGTPIIIETSSSTSTTTELNML